VGLSGEDLSQSAGVTASAQRSIDNTVAADKIVAYRYDKRPPAEINEYILLGEVFLCTEACDASGKGRAVMPCRVGMTTRPDERRTKWETRVIGFANWQILNSFRSEAAAKEYANAYAIRNGCESSLDDPEPRGSPRDYEERYDWWYVYYFEYGSLPD
jgi:hypothetical protein